MPVITVHRQTLLNEALSPTARLLYVTLTASLDDDEIKLPDVARLLGLEDVGELRPFITELTNVGLTDYLDHAGRGRVLTVHYQPALPEQRSHACVPCQDCQACSCDYMKGICALCHQIRQVRAESEADIARWQQQVDAGKTYAMGANATRLHRWDCKSLNSVEKSLSSMESAIEHARAGSEHAYVYWPKLPTLYTAEELRRKGTRKRNCGMCGPDPL
jgi:hypothetical protein